MFTLTISYDAEKDHSQHNPIEDVPMNLFQNFVDSYIDSKPYENTVYATNVEGVAGKLSIDNYIDMTSTHPSPELIFKLAKETEDGITIAVKDEIQANYYEELLNTLFKDCGFDIWDEDEDAELKAAQKALNDEISTATAAKNGVETATNADDVELPKQFQL